MKKVTTKLIASALIISFLVLPADLSAKQKRGANLIVTRLDGSQVAGELIAVKRDSLLLLSNGRDESIDLADIKTVRIVRKSRAGLFSGIGGATGVLATGVIVFGNADSDLFDNNTGEAFVLIGAIAGAIGALSGLLVGSVAGVDSSFTVAGQSEAAVSAYWDKLGAHARVPRLPGCSLSSR